MLEILDVDSLNLKIKKRKTKKTQIMLYDTQRRYDDFIRMLKYRRNGKYENIPHFCINKMGKVFKILDPDYSSNTFDEPKIDNKQIKIAIENLGWLNKNTITGVYNNWIGDPFRGNPHIRGWRGHYYWDVYSKDQMRALADLCLVLCVNYSIDYFAVPSSGYIESAKNINGIVSKSNFLDIYTDINPSFNFNIFEENVKQPDPRI
jgi:hypothetical protein